MTPERKATQYVKTTLATTALLSGKTFSGPHSSVSNNILIDSLADQHDAAERETCNWGKKEKEKKINYLVGQLSGWNKMDPASISYPARSVKSSSWHKLDPVCISCLVCTH